MIMLAWLSMLTQLPLNFPLVIYLWNLLISPQSRSVFLDAYISVYIAIQN